MKKKKQKERIINSKFKSIWMEEQDEKSNICVHEWQWRAGFPTKSNKTKNHKPNDPMKNVGNEILLTKS